MSLYVVDTHALLWYLSGAPQLSTLAREAIDEATHEVNQLIVPAIVIAETVMLIEKRRVTLDSARLISALKTQPAIELSSLVPEVALQIQSLTALGDIHDRLIVAEAIARGAAVITRDAAITESGLVQTLW